MSRIQPTVRFVLVHPLSDDGDVDQPDTWVPANPERFAIEVQLFVGTEGDDGTDVFELVVCSPRWLADNFGDERLDPLRLSSGIVARGLWLMPRWDYRAVLSALESLMTQAAADAWPDVGNFLSRYVPWEFEYVHDRDRGVGVDVEPWSDSPIDA